MDSFHWIVLAIALVLLIIGLTATAMMLSGAKSDEKYPKTYGECPDGWKKKDGYCYALDERTETDNTVDPAKNRVFDDEFNANNLTVSTSTSAEYNELDKAIKGYEEPDNYTKFVSNQDGSSNYDMYAIKFDDTVTRCDKKAWAEYNKIRWDGVTNYNDC
jgi:hypothetical protein